MQNRYTGDIGDFGKFGLLRSILSFSPLKLGINWYLVDPEELREGSRNDGKYIQYLYESSSKYNDCDPELYIKLRTIVRKERCVNAIKEKEVLPRSTVFYDDKLSFKNVEGKNGRTEKRKLWVQEGLRKLSSCNLVLFDPDNGFEVKSFKRHYKKGIKYLFYDEIVNYFKRGQSLIIYQHRDMNKQKIYVQRYAENLR